jgi:hypothetical protein
MAPRIAKASVSLRKSAVVIPKPAVQQPSTIQKQGLWVYTGALPPEFDVARAIREDREERILKLACL